MYYGNYGYNAATTNSSAEGSSIFASEDTLSDFARGMNKHEAAALYQVLHALGYRYDPTALERWRKSK